MAKRLLSCTPREMLALDRDGLLQAIAASEGRTIACETIGAMQPMLLDITNAELAAAQGADLILMNLIDLQNPSVQGLPADVPPEEVIRTVRRLSGRPVGVNLEPVPPDCTGDDPMWRMTEGRRATVDNARRAADLGVSFILLTGNPGAGVTTQAIAHTLAALKAAVGDRVVLAAGKMHASGILSEAGEHIITPADVDAFVQAGADIVLFPAPGTVPGITTEYIHARIAQAHRAGALAMTSIGTSQEGADVDTIRRIALACKMAGADIHHLGDTGYAGMALPENIFAYSVAVRGVRHTYRRMAMSLGR